MATISARIDDQLKESAEQIAESIGIPLSSVINVFLRRFIAEKGFPFDVKALDLPTRTTPKYNSSELEKAVKRAIKNQDSHSSAESFVYFDAETQSPVEVYNERK